MTQNMKLTQHTKLAQNMKLAQNISNFFSEVCDYENFDKKQRFSIVWLGVKIATLTRGMHVFPQNQRKFPYPTW